LNVNADLAAAAIAGALDASALIIMTDVAGIYRNWPDQSSLINAIDAHELNEIKGSFAQGMAPKVQAALDAITGGAKAVRIIDGTDPHSFADALLSKGGTLNVNADLAAAAIAGALDASALIIMTDVAGIYRNWPDESSLINAIDARELNEIKGSFTQGMAPKVQAALDAITGGAKAVRIIDGTDPHSFADALLSKGGTLVVA